MKIEVALQSDYLDAEGWVRLEAILGQPLLEVLLEMAEATYGQAPPIRDGQGSQAGSRA